MKCSELWLREWVNPPLSREKLADTLMMAGLEVEEIKPVAPPFSGVIIGEIETIAAHPEKPHLSICKVNIDSETTRSLSIICGASNITPKMKVAVALLNAHLPDDVIIKSTTIQGIESQGMLCAAKELGLSEEETQAIIELPREAPIGKDLREFLLLDDYTLDISITPNRGDCLSVKGLAREIAALTHTPLKSVSFSIITPSIQDELPIEISAMNACSVYVGRIIRGISLNTITPTWIKERLARSHMRSIHPVVDIVNYVMLELGQPMHAFDLATIRQQIKIRYATHEEKIVLLDNSEQILEDDTLIIADQDHPIAIAGVMGGLESSVTLNTTDIFLESAYFSPVAVAKARQFYRINSDAAYRFERGIDPTQQRAAIERASQLIVEILGGAAGPITEKNREKWIAAPILLHHQHIQQVLGFVLDPKKIKEIFTALQFTYQYDNEAEKWSVLVPPYRNDLSIAEDLIEEIARLYGYNNIPATAMEATLAVKPQDKVIEDMEALRGALIYHGFHEIISYSFIEKKWQALLDPLHLPKELLNPITADMSVMRTSLWPGLLSTLAYNYHHQQYQINLFEIGKCFIVRDDHLFQEYKLAGLMMGLSYPEQWGIPPKEVDFYDIKGKIETIFSHIKGNRQLIFKCTTHQALHPGQTTAIYLNEDKIGIMGRLHPQLVKTLDLSGKTSKIFLFELNLPLPMKDKFYYHEISKFPEIRRDLAIIVNETVPAKAIQDTIMEAMGPWLKEIFVFDVYQGKGISPGLKSVALAVILQHPSRTLIDAEVTDLMECAVSALKDQLGAILRS